MDRVLVVFEEIPLLWLLLVLLLSFLVAACSFLYLAGEDSLEEVICWLLAWELLHKLLFHEFDYF